jgi:hypothetical protein
MKKFCYLLLAAAMTLGLAACSQADNPGSPTVDPTTEGQVIIKEINVGGSVKASTGKGAYGGCKGIILYNNGGKAVTLSNFGIAFCAPMNANVENKNIVDGKLYFEAEGWIHALQGLWYYPGSVTIQPYSDLVIALTSAIDHTQTTDGALLFDLSNADMACYDLAVFNNKDQYEAPAKVTEDKWLKGFKYSTANAWPVSIMCPALYIFSAPTTVTLSEWLADEANAAYVNGDTKQSVANKAAKIPMEWVIDGVELFQTTSVEKSTKRLPTSIDAGYGLYLNGKCYSAYRNIDEKATVNLGDNITKLVYNYADGVEGTTDPSGIDAVASIKKGAKIIYQDTNNSSVDFHLRKAWSLK